MQHLPSPTPSDSSLLRLLTPALVGALGLSLLLLWLLSSLTGVSASAAWFPGYLHVIVETFSITVAVLVFAVVWHSNQPVHFSNPLLGCAFLAIALLDLAHMLSYKGMPDFVTPASSEKAIAFWLVSRFLLAFTLLAVAFRLRYRPTLVSRPMLLVTALTVVGLTGYLQLFHPQAWPRTFIEGQGLTTFKVAMEWVIIALLALAAWRFWSRRKAEQPYFVSGMLAATLVSILAELCFAAYSNVNSLYSLFGHLYKIASYCFIYQVVFVSSVRAPYQRLAIEIEERLAAERKAEFLTFYDSLTGLPKLELLRDRTLQALVGARSGQGSVALLFLDIDYFKMVNDSFGHAFGDRLLCAVAARLEQLLPKTATLCRAGGDEFVVLLGGLKDAESASLVVQRIVDGLGAPVAVDHQEIGVSISIGVAVGPNDGEDFPSLQRNAEMAMYKAKDAGRGTWCYYDAAMDAEMRDRLQLIHGLRLATARGELVLHYQIQVDLLTGQVIGAEALVRWQHPQWGLLPPERFVPAAEEHGLIVGIGEWVIREACRQLAQWHAEGVAIPSVAVNVAAPQLKQAAFEQVVADALARAGLPAAALELELTESSLIQDTEQVRAMLARLEALGVRLSIDDFGTGYSCLAYLRRLSVNTLKIDRSFVLGLDNADGHAIVVAIIQLARSLGLKTLAEGVEDDTMATELRLLGCDQAQGFLYAKPVSAEAVPAIVARRLARHRMVSA